MLAILLIPAALCYTFGKMVKDTRQGWAILAAMTVVFVPLVLPCALLEQRGNPALSALGADQHASALAPGGNIEGKELRFGIVNSAIWATATTAASNGSVNSMHDSFTPLAGLVPLWMIQLGEIIYGGVGSGLYGMLLFVIVSVFIAGLMVGRTPEYLGNWPRSPTRRPRGEASWCWPRRSSDSASVTSTGWGRAVHGAEPDERRECRRPRDSEGRG
jgi:K+-transporting ATPase ATPase A chain